MRRALALTVVLALLAGTAQAHEQRRPERRLSGLVNLARERHALSHVWHGTRLHRFGRRQVERMIDCRCVKHAQPPLFCGRWGQAVGIGRSAIGLMRAFLASPEHRRILLDPSWHRIGVGARWTRDGLLYVALEFCA